MLPIHTRAELLEVAEGNQTDLVAPKKDEIIWKEFRDGSEEAFAYVYDNYLHILYNYASKFTSDKDLVKDCIHDLFIKLWSNRHNLGNTTSVKYYLLKAMRHTMLDALMNRKKILFEQENFSEEQFAFVLPQESLLIKEQLTEEQQREINKALNALTKRQKEAIFLRFYHDMSYDEISSIMSLHVDSSYNLLSKALQILKKNIRRTVLILLFCIHNF